MSEKTAAMVDDSIAESVARDYLAHRAYVSGNRTLQRMRREAGFRSAKDFAEHIGIPASMHTASHSLAAPSTS